MTVVTLRPGHTISRLLAYHRPVLQLCCSRPNNSFPGTTSGQQRRNLFDSLLSSTLGSPPLRHLSHSQTLQYPPGLLFKIISSIDQYPQFLPFLLSSTISARDDRGYPSRAQLRVGYKKFGLEEVWDSLVKCDENAGIVEARSAEGRTAEDGLFETLRTRWEIKPAGSDTTGRNSALANLNIEVQFRNPVYDQMFIQMEGRVASAMMTAFEKRVQELHGQNRTS